LIDHLIDVMIGMGLAGEVVVRISAALADLGEEVGRRAGRG